MSTPNRNYPTAPGTVAPDVPFYLNTALLAVDSDVQALAAAQAALDGAARDARAVATSAQQGTTALGTRVDLLEEASEISPGDTSDVTMALHTAQDGSRFRQELAVVLGASTGLVNIQDHGAVQDGITDDAAAWRAAEAAARAANGTLYIPAGPLRLGSRVELGCSLRNDGDVLIDAATEGCVDVVRTLAPLELDPAALTGLVEGSQVIGGTGGTLGDLWLYSSEHLIERNNGTAGQHYTKRELSRLVSTGGALSRPLCLTYEDPSTVTATLFPFERPITLQGLTITVDGPAGTHPLGLVNIYRSDVTANDVTVVNASGEALTNGVVIRQAANVELNRPRIHGFNLAGAGYGIARYDTLDQRTNDPEITGCRHAVSGLANKGARDNRGTWEGGLDDHWAWDWRVTDPTSVVAAGKCHIQAAGADVQAEGGTYTGGRTVMGIRNDTPEMGGYFRLQGAWTWTPGPNEGSRWVMGYTTPTLPVFAYGRTLRSPRARVLGGDLRIQAGVSGAIVSNYGAAFAHEHWQTEVSGVNHDPAAWILAVWTDRNAAAHPGQTRGPSIVVDGMEFGAATDSVLIYDTGGGAGPALDFEARNCQNLYLKLPESGLGRILVDRSHVKRLFRSAVAAAPAPGDLTFRDCRLDGMGFNGTHWATFEGNTWTGAASASALAMDLRVKAYRGNLHAVGSTGHPTRADGYTDPTYYKTA